MAKKKPTSKEKESFLRGSCNNMTYKDLKRKAITLGMPFPDAVAAGVFDLIGYINKSANIPDPNLINQYDEWMDKQLESTGIPKDDPLRSSRLRLGFLGDESEDGERKTKRVPGIKKPKTKKPPKEKDGFGLVKGTMKSYVWELTSKGYDLERVTRRMHKKFPEANTKSISLWYRKAKKQIKS